MIEKNNIIGNNKYIHDKISDQYNKKHTEIYNIYEQERLRNTIKKVVGFTKQGNNSVLDFGAGTGNLSHFFLETGCKVTALDISEKSLKRLSDTYSKYKSNLNTKVFDGKEIPFKNDSFEIIATYSVLHHIPDYLSTLKDMIRVLKKGGILYIDHEANKNKREPSEQLKEYYKESNKLSSKIKKIIKTGEIFEFIFWKSIFIRTFINKRFREEGDIHVFIDDHIERDEIIAILKKNKMKILEEKNYLLYNKNISIEKHNDIKDKINDTKYIIAQKY